MSAPVRIGAGPPAPPRTTAVRFGGGPPPPPQVRARWLCRLPLIGARVVAWLVPLALVALVVASSL